jgi:sterol 3beta-glucosyltransferase
MRVLIAAVGSRGDVAPHTGLGAALRAAGHNVTIAAYGMFADLVTASGLAFRELPGDPRLLGASAEGQRWQRGGAGPLGVARFVRLVAEHMRDVHAALLAAARQDTDVMLVAGQVMFGGYHIAESLGLPSMGLALQPMHPTGQFPPPWMTTRSLGSWANRAIGRGALRSGTAALSRPSKQLWADGGLPELDVRAMFRRQDATRWPVFYGFSQAVVPRPPDWRDGLEVAGYWWPNRTAGWTPPADLEDFLDAGPPPVFVGFGSRNPDDADRLNALVAEARRQAGVRMVIQAGWAGLTVAGDDVITIGDVPHDWLFPRMAAVVHHAGAGTAASGLRAGVPAVSVPLIIDQPFWADRLASCGVGPPPIPYKRLSGQALATAIKDAVTRESYRRAAQDLARRLTGEDAAAPVVKALNRGW